MSTACERPLGGGGPSHVTWMLWTGGNLIILWTS